MDQTPNLNLPIPNADAVPPMNISDEFPRIALALTMLDAIIHTLQGVVEGKAATDHTQAMSTITGLLEALAEKMPANATFSLDDLQDVQGAAAALVNYVLVKNASGFWVPSTALAALGVHNHAISEVVGLAGLLDDMSEALDLLVMNKAEKAITVTGAGLATGGGSLASNRVITVPKATDAEHVALTRDDVAATPRGIGLAMPAYLKWRPIDDVNTTNLGVWSNTLLSGFESLHFEGAFRVATDAVQAFFQYSVDAGTNWQSTNYVSNGATLNESSYGGEYGTGTSGFRIGVGAMSNAHDAVFRFQLHNFNVARSKRGIMQTFYIGGGIHRTSLIGYRHDGAPAAANAMRLFPNSGQFSTIRLFVEGKP